jgi:CheY-like chemotaxis protein
VSKAPFRWPIILPPLFNTLANRLTPLLLHKAMILQEVQDPDQALRINKLLQGVDSVQNQILKPLMMVFSPSSPRPVASHMNQLVQEAAKRVETEAMAMGVALELFCDPNLSGSSLDSDMVREGLVNLLRSSLFAAAGSAAKRVRIGTRQSGNFMQVVCQDTGSAIPTSEQERLFDIARSTDIESLGLCVVASVAKAHGGRISVRSQEGVGNAYLLEFPMIDATLAPSIETSLEGKKVLVVDDEAFLLECLVDAVQGWGCEVTPCTLAAEAIQKMQCDSYDMIISDIRMPGLSGIQLYQWIKEHQSAMSNRILFTTGDTFDPETKDFLETLQLPHLGKPFDLKRLRQALTDLMVAV